MSQAKTNHFDQAAATWDDNPMRIALMRAVGEAILREARPTKDMDVLDYGCGTGLVGLYLLPHVRSVTGADNSVGMLDVLHKKIKDGGLGNMRTVRLDLEHDPVPAGRYHLVVSSMALHHIADTPGVLGAFYQLLRSFGKRAKRLREPESTARGGRCWRGERADASRESPSGAVVR